MKNLINKKFGRLLVLSKSEIKTKDKRTQWNCICKCGNRVLAENRTLLYGRKKSCGCLKIEKSINKINKINLNHPKKTHGMSRTRIYKIWFVLNLRCKNKSDKRYSNYGGRGINVCNEWSKFENFYNDMKDTYKENLSIDRIDNNKGYSKENCRWANYKEQANNRRSNHVIEYNGERMNITQWSKKLGIARNTIYYRLKNGLELYKL